METRKRSIAKALSWRLIAVIITTVTTYLFTRETSVALGVGIVDSLVKLGTYYGHERLWTRLSFGRRKASKDDYTI
ncbi:MAG: DUF2061 domain-containing protein [Dehalococcoidales bacterium]